MEGGREAARERGRERKVREGRGGPMTKGTERKIKGEKYQQFMKQETYVMNIFKDSQCHE